MKGASQCPACGSYRTGRIRLEDRDYDHAGCLKCQAIWEPFSPDQLVFDDDALSVFKAPCDNCAFRPGSPERSDPKVWAKIRRLVTDEGSAFFCHKGMEIPKDGAAAFTAPVTEEGRPDTTKMRLCAGYLSHRIAHIYKGRPADETA